MQRFYTSVPSTSTWPQAGNHAAIHGGRGSRDLDTGRPSSTPALCRDNGRSWATRPGQAARQASPRRRPAASAPSSAQLHACSRRPPFISRGPEAAAAAAQPAGLRDPTENPGRGCWSRRGRRAALRGSEGGVRRVHSQLNAPAPPTLAGISAGPGGRGRPEGPGSSARLRAGFGPEGPRTGWPRAPGGGSALLLGEGGKRASGSIQEGLGEPEGGPGLLGAPTDHSKPRAGGPQPQGPAARWPSWHTGRVRSFRANRCHWGHHGSGAQTTALPATNGDGVPKREAGGGDVRQRPSCLLQTRVCCRFIPNAVYFLPCLEAKP